MWPDRKQPITAIPDVETGPAQNGKVIVKMSCKTKGASIGYCLGTRKTWHVYEKPITLNVGTRLTAKAIRIGYKTSPEIKKTVQ
jgi:hypothetical protein